MSPSDALVILSGGLATALFAAAMWSKVADRAGIAGWLRARGWRRPMPVIALMAALDGAMATATVALAGQAAGSWLTFSAALLLGVWRAAARQRGVPDCPCLGTNEGDSLLAGRLLWLVGISSVLALAFAPASAPEGASLTVLLAALAFVVGGLAVAGSYRRALPTRAGERAMSNEDAARGLAVLAGTDAGQPVAIFFGSTRCDGCLRAGQLFAAMARDVGLPCLIDMDVDVGGPARVGGAALVRADKALRSALAIRARPTLVLAGADGIRSFSGLDRCLYGIAQLPGFEKNPH